MNMKFRTIPISSLKPAAYNPRKDLKSRDPEYEKLKRSIEEFGYVEPIIVNQPTGHVVGGHQRLKVLKDLGHTKVRVVLVNLPDDKERALNLALNKISGDWDDNKLAVLLGQLLDTPEFDVSLTGFDSTEIEDLLTRSLDQQGLTGNDDSFDLDGALDRSQPAITKVGDLLKLGSHRLLCGDSTEAMDVRRLMGSERAVLFATDPPYQVSFDGTNHNPKRRKRSHAKFNWDDPNIDPDLYPNFIRCAIEQAIDPRAAWYMWHASRNQSKVEEAWQEAGAFVHQQILWIKEQAVMNRSWYLWQHEPCFFGWIKGKKPRRVAKEKLSTVWNIAHQRGIEHPTVKPLEVFEIPIRQHTVRDDLCYEPFAGSGSQLIAAEGLGRRCYAIEKDPYYCDLIIRRWIHFVGVRQVTRRLLKRYPSATPKEVTCA